MTEKQAVRDNLPRVPDTGVVGRGRELAEIIKALLDPDIPIVTLVGLAGMGKTALALAIAHRLREQGEFPGGIVWLNASIVQSLDEVWESVRETLDLPSPQAARRHLREHPTLLILDGLNEAVQDMEILAFLDRLPRPSKVLVTSRERVGLVGKELIVEGPKYKVEAALVGAVGDGAQVTTVVTGDRDIIPVTRWTITGEHARVAQGAAYEVKAKNYAAAAEAYRQILVSFDPTGLTDDDRRRCAEISHRMGTCLRLDGQWGPAVEQQEDTFRQFKKLRDFHGQGRAYLEIARAYQAMNSYDLAALYYRDAHRLFRRAGDVMLAATAKEELGNLEYYLHVLKPAMADWEEAARLYEQAGRPGKVAIIRQNLAQVQAG